MNDAEARLAEGLALDLERILGTGVLVQDLEISGDGPVTVEVACLVDGQAREIHVVGATAPAAVAEVVRLAADLRLSAAFWRIVGPA